jgi:hypothetical protein
MIQALVFHGRTMRLYESWRIPRLPMNVPRAGVAMISPRGVTRFCLGTCFGLLRRFSLLETMQQLSRDRPFIELHSSQLKKPSG